MLLVEDIALREACVFCLKAGLLEACIESDNATVVSWCINADGVPPWEISSVISYINPLLREHLSLLWGFKDRQIKWPIG